MLMHANPIRLVWDKLKYMKNIQTNKEENKVEREREREREKERNESFLIF